MANTWAETQALTHNLLIVNQFKKTGNTFPGFERYTGRPLFMNNKSAGAKTRRF